MKILRTAIVTAGVAATMLSSTTPASAATAAAFEGKAEIGCFGCGQYGPDGNDATFTVVGTYKGATGTFAGKASFTVDEPTGAACVVSGSANGTITVGTNGPSAFTWSRVGAFAIISVPADGITASAAFKVISPVGNPCGFPVVAQFAGVAAGA